MVNVLEWLEAAEQQHPGKLAFADVESQVTYAELKSIAQVIGSRLAQAVEPRTPIGMYLDKNCAAICALFGAVYAGCCYSFIDLRQPAQRIAKIVATLGDPVVVTDENHIAQARELFPENTAFALIEELASGEKDCELLDKRRAGALSTDPVYINFTSGSTGDPKGVAVGHSSIIDFIPVFTRTLGLESNDVFACQAPLDFDVSVKDIYGSLQLGATVNLIPREYFSEPVRLMDYLCERNATVLVWAVSAMCFVSIMGGFDYKIPSSVRLVAFSGEVMPIKQLKIWRKALPDAAFFNVYGPTEITCNCTYYLVDRDYELDETLPMGKAFDNERVFLVGEDGKEVVEPGVLGEIYVGGATLAIGYYRNPEKTAEAFVQNPLNDAYYDRVYKTGDLASYNEQGDLIYLSRVDHQIKHMGQRIELGEIDAAAHGVEGVTRACCIYDSARKRIRMFYTGDIDKKLLMSKLHEALPPFMMPNNIKHISEMPMNKNGKIDRGKLERGEVE